MNITDHALEMIANDMVIGLGTGRAAAAFIDALGARVKQGLRVRGVPTSERSAEQAKSLGIPLATLGDVEGIDVAFDGADEIDPRLDLIKGYGGALVREKIVAASAKRFVVLAQGPDKMVPTLGFRGKVPVEIVPFAAPLCLRRMTALGLFPELRRKDGETVVTDNHNWIIDCCAGPIAKPRVVEQEILAIPGVVDTGLFLGMAHVALIQNGDEVVRKTREV